MTQEELALLKSLKPGEHYPHSLYIFENDDISSLPEGVIFDGDVDIKFNSTLRQIRNIKVCGDFCIHCCNGIAVISEIEASSINIVSCNAKTIQSLRSKGEICIASCRSVSDLKKCSCRKSLNLCFLDNLESVAELEVGELHLIMADKISSLSGIKAEKLIAFECSNLATIKDCDILGELRIEHCSNFQSISETSASSITIENCPKYTP